jgi:uncharacterized protein
LDKELVVNGETLTLDPSGALYWPEMRALVLADLHFEKGSSFARSGQLLPPYDTRATLKRIASLCARYRPETVIALGDSFHDAHAHDRLDAYERDMLSRLGAEADWIWIAGNHDPEPPSWLNGRIVEDVALGALVFRHEPSPLPSAGEIAGHLHPCASVTRRGHTLRRRCFVSDGMRLLLPAFGAYAGGLDVRDKAVRSLFAADFLAYVLGARRVYAIAA